MNTLLSHAWLKEYLPHGLSVEEFSARMTDAGNSVERIHRLAETFAHMVVGEVESVTNHPNASKLRIAMTNIGGQTVQIVCGGANLAQGQKVAVALPGARVRWHGEGDWVELKETEIRGSKSYGMICAAAELGFEKLPQGDHDIWDLSELTDAPAGTPLVNALQLDDVLLDIEVTTNRPDAMAVIGQAREGSAVTGAALRWSPPTLGKGKGSAPKVHVEDAELCPRYMAVRIDGVRVGASPWWMQKRLLLAGHRPINLIVDITNYVLLEYGHPLHAFDAATVSGEKIIVRRAKAGEQIEALDGKTYELTDTMLVIADVQRPIAIAGVMGGQASGTTEATTSVILESAAFDPVSVRRTSRALNLTSDAQQLFEKGLSTQATAPALARAMELIVKLTGGTVSAVADVQAHAYRAPVFPFDPSRAVARIGVEIPVSDMLSMLECLGFSTKKKGKVYELTVPYWRDRDIEDEVDFSEEIARLYGYARLPDVLPPGAPPEPSHDPVLAFERELKERLLGIGCTEFYSLAFLSDVEVQAYGSPESEWVRLLNPLVSDQNLLRPSVIPSVLKAIAENQKRVPTAAVFEIAPEYRAVVGDIPQQPLEAVIAVYGPDGAQNLSRLRGLLARLWRELGLKPWKMERQISDTRWHPGRSADLLLGTNRVGTVGQISDALASASAVDGPVAVAHLHVEALLSHRTSRAYQPIPTFPDVRRDLAFVLPLRVEFAVVEQAIRAADPLVQAVELFDVYQGRGVSEGAKSMAVHLTLRAADRTLDAVEADAVIAKVESALALAFGATIRK